MKHLLQIGILALSFLITGCSDNFQEDQFASHEDNSKPREATHREVPKFQEDLRDIVSQDTEERIGRGKNKQGFSVNIGETVGFRNLQPTHVNLSVAREDKGNNANNKPSNIYIRRHQKGAQTSEAQHIVVEEGSEIVPAHPAIVEPVVSATSNQSSHEANMLFFVSSKLAHVDANIHKENCWSSLNQSVKDNGFLLYLDSLQWRVSMSFYSDEHPELSLLTKKNQGMFSSEPVEPTPVLSRDMYNLGVSEKAFSDSMTPFSKMFPEKTQDDHLPQLVSPRPDTEDVLGALSNLILGNPELTAGNGRLNIVIVDNGQFPFYTEEEWRNFYSLHPYAKLILLSSRRSNISNLLHVINNRTFIEWLPICSSDNMAQELGTYLSY